MLKSTKLKKSPAALWISLVLALTACGTFVGNPDDETSTSVPKSSVRFDLTDAPVDDVTKVYITVASLAVRPEAGDWLDIPLSTSERIDLLSLQDGVVEKLAMLNDLDPGTYDELRLVLDDTAAPAVVDADGVEEELKVPSGSGSASGLKIKSSFTKVADEALTMTLDFDLRKSLKATGNSGKYTLNPVLRLVANEDSGTLTGTSADGETVCVYSEDAVKDASAACENAINSAKIKGDQYTIAFLPEGSYFVRVFKKDGSYTDIEEAVAVTAGESTEVP